jgi:hypothetical protein
MSQINLKEVSKNLIRELYGNPGDYEFNGEMSHGSLSNILPNLCNKNGINFFPSDYKGSCCDGAIFLSLKNQPRKINLPRNEMKSLKVTIENMVQHLLGECMNRTNEVILITDSIETETINPWLDNLKSIQRMNCSIDILYVRKNGEFEITNKVLGLK